MPLPKAQANNKKSRKLEARKKAKASNQKEKAPKFERADTSNFRQHEGQFIAGGGIPEVSDLDMAFPTRYRKLLPVWEQLTEEEQAGNNQYCHNLNQLFFRGGDMSKYFTAKPGYDQTKIHRYIKATLGDYGPKHEHKIGGIAHALANWCVANKVD